MDRLIQRQPTWHHINVSAYLSQVNPFCHVACQDPCKRSKTPNFPTLANGSRNREKSVSNQDLVPTRPMASLAIFAAVQPATSVKGLAGSSLTGTKLHVKPSRQSLRLKNFRSGAVVAKYGDKSVYFDLEDLGNTTGQWDLYGSDAASPYNSLQSKFFETFAAPFTKRGLLLKFLILGGGFALAYVSATAPPELLPIKKGPQQKPKLGPRGKI